MEIIWRDVDLNTHKIDLSDAVDVKINGISLSTINGKGVRITSNNSISVMPIAANSVVVMDLKE